MTMEIPLSLIKGLPFDFEQAVQDFIQAKKDHLTTVGVPAPSAPHHWVEGAVRRIPGSRQQPDDFVADYKIIDDSPPPLTVGEKKTAIAAGIHAEAMSRLNQITPPLKAKLWNLQTREAHLARAKGESTDAHETIIEESEARNQKMEGILRHQAELESQLHDLPEDMIDVWKWAPFPES